MRASAILRTAFLLTSVLALAACGGGGGGGNGGTSFISWDQVQPGTAVAFNGTSQEVTVEIDATNTATSVGPISAPGAAKVTSVYIDGGMGRLVPTNSSISTSQSTVKTGNLFLEDAIPVFTSEYDANVSNNLQNFALIADPFTQNWNYQTYGIWERDLGNGSFREIFASFGSVTPNSSVPIIGSAMYNGDLLGEYIAPDGSLFFTSADVSIDADFATSNMDFQSSNTVRVDVETLSNLVADGNLDLSGTLSGAPGSNSFNGPLTNTGADLNGTGNAILYGPNVEEVGGTFALKGSGVEAYAGSFGASQ